ncbi:MAG TPA: BlaI/MecI/CopY family transcriptional regulator [Thermoleophilia bacterium]|nr:BlaI/MecI/CopY family transcriptional regulator [Thermoleophilia bacterium]
MTESIPKWQRRGRSRDLTGIGWLEADVLRIVWDHGEVTVRDVYEELRERRRIAYTTVMSALRNLAAKDLLEQDRNRPAYAYRPRATDVEVAGSILDAVVDKVMGGRIEPLIAYLQARSDGETSGGSPETSGAGSGTSGAGSGTSGA